MDGWLKTLVACACVVIIAGGGYYFWSEYKNAQIREAANARLTAQALERARVAKLTSPYCNSLASSALSKVTGAEFRTPEIIADLRTCYQMDRLGYVERRDLIDIGLFK